jgi:hypothetical protein
VSKPRKSLFGSADPSSPEFQRGDAIGYELGKTYREMRDARPSIRKLGRRLLRDARDLAEQLGFDGDDAAIIVAALLCGMHEMDLSQKPEGT